MTDVVYIVRSDIVMAEELRYSLRTVDNLKHGNVWIAGGCPDYIRPDKALKIKQEGESKWERVTYTIKKVCECKDVSDTFYLFNDDFFIMQPTDEIPPIYNGYIQERIDGINKWRGFWTSRYAKMLNETMKALEDRGLDTKNYAVHIPMPIEKEKALEVIEEFKGQPMFRCLYGNYWDIGGENRPDVKIADNGKEPEKDAQFLSTSDTSFKWGKAGRYLRRTFPEPSRYEVSDG